MLKSLVILFFLTTLSSQANQNIINIDMLSKEAKTQKKHLMLFFHKFGCGYCEKMENKTFDDPGIESYIEKYFIIVDLGIEDEGTVMHQNFRGTIHAYAKSLEISFYPTIGFVDGNGSIVHGVIGYRDAEQLMPHLIYMKKNAYVSMDFEAFKTHMEFLEE